MKCVKKQLEPTTFIEWKAQENEEWQPSYATLQNPEKRSLHEALLTEQGHVCCYCGRAISLASSHIEHFQPQELREDLALEYENLHTSCIREVAPGAPLHCGHAKGSELTENLIISPMDADCEGRFLYSSQDGAIYPTDKEDVSATYMIRLLKLDVSFLQVRRAEALKNVFDNDFVESATDEELTQLARAYRALDGTGQMASFGHVLSRFAEQLLGQRI